MELDINFLVISMSKWHSITYRITGLTFLIIAFTVFLLVFLADLQMAESFQDYLIVQHMGSDHSAMMSSMSDKPTMPINMGPHENFFLASVHQSLIWVGLGILIAGLIGSYVLARSITIPLRNLSQVAKQIEQGNLGQTVLVQRNDEVGQLAGIVNRMSENLATNTKLRQQLLANIAHELRTPLAIIQGHLEGMVDGVIEPSVEQLKSLHEEAVRLNRLIADLRDLSLAEVRQLVLEKRPVDMNQLVERTVLMLQPLAEDKRITIHCELAENIPEMNIDADRMHQVIYNILGNAIRYSAEQGAIQVTTTMEMISKLSWLVIAISDNGPGIIAEDIPYIFDHFYRGDKSRDRKSGGSGIGLAIAKSLVESHGGEILVDSQVGNGSTFYIRLPIEG